MVCIKLLTVLDIPNGINSMTKSPHLAQFKLHKLPKCNHSVCYLPWTCFQGGPTLLVLWSLGSLGSRTHTPCRWWPAQGSLALLALNKPSGLGLVASISWYSKLCSCFNMYKQNGLLVTRRKPVHKVKDGFSRSRKLVTSFLMMGTCSERHLLWVTVWTLSVHWHDSHTKVCPLPLGFLV